MVNNRIRLVLCSFVALALLSACAQPAPVPKPKPTRTPKPTFTVTLGTPTLVSMVSTTPSPGDTDVASPTATPSAAATGMPSPTTAATGTVSPSATGARTATPSATATTTPTATPSPTATTVPTKTPRPTATPLPCAPGYDLHIHPSPGFSACHPTGWLVSEAEDPEQSARWVYFAAPTSNRDTGEGLKMIALRVSPNTTGVSGDEFLGATALSLIDEYSGFLIEWPYTVLLDGRQAVEANYQAGLPFQGGRVSVIGWKAIFLEGDQQWLIQVVGRSEYREELEGIHDQFVAGFHLLPVQ